MFDKKALYNISYGLYIISTLDGERPVGCISNTLAQVTSTPYQVSVALNKENATTQALLRTGRFVGTCLTEEATMELIGMFGFHTSADTDKFAGYAVGYDEAGIPYVNVQFCSRFSVRVVKTLDVGTHIIFVGEVEEAETASGTPMTYKFYRAVKGGKTPPKAASYVGDLAPAPGEAAPAPTETAPAAPAPEGSRVAWRCTVCGYIYDHEELPEDFHCPMCGAPREKFERITLP